MPGCPTSLDKVGRWLIVLAEDVGGGCLDIFSLIYHSLDMFFLSLGDGPI